MGYYLSRSRQAGMVLLISLVFLLLLALLGLSSMQGAISQEKLPAAFGSATSRFSRPKAASGLASLWCRRQVSPCALATRRLRARHLPNRFR